MHKLLSGVLITLLLVGCGSGSSSHPRLPQSPAANDVRHYPVEPDGPYAEVLAQCAFEYIRDGHNDINRTCPMSTLPLLGQEEADVDINLILSRTLVSHDWMAVRFEQLLNELPNDLLQMFQAVTAVVIGADIRPSYYWAATGAIYLDPSRLWLTEAEKNTISRAPDFRADFGSELAFTELWRYTKNGDNAWRQYSLSGPETQRPLSDIVHPMASLLFHELAHANDFIPPAQIPHLNPDNTVLEAAVALEDDGISAQLYNDRPLQSEMLFGLAQVMYVGESASAAQRALTAEEVGLEFANDAATDPYAYSTRAEDTAMLFEEAMMRYHFGIERDVAFTDTPEGPDVWCDDYIVRWGNRGRVGEPSVLARLEMILPLFLDSHDVEDYVAAMGAPTSLEPGLGWCESINPTASMFGLQKARPERQPLPVQEPRHGPGHPHHH